MSDEALVDVERRGAVCVVALRCERKLNALSTALEGALGEALASDDVRSSACVVIAGGARAFSAGADVDELRDRRPEDVVAYYRDTGDVYERVAGLAQPTLSAISGYCLGAGLELALATDFRIADETAIFGFPEVSIGILPSSGGTHRVTRLLGPALAASLTKQAIDAAAESSREAGLLIERLAYGLLAQTGDARERGAG